MSTHKTTAQTSLSEAGGRIWRSSKRCLTRSYVRLSLDTARCLNRWSAKPLAAALKALVSARKHDLMSSQECIVMLTSDERFALLTELQRDPETTEAEFDEVWRNS